MPHNGGVDSDDRLVESHLGIGGESNHGEVGAALDYGVDIGAIEFIDDRFELGLGD